MVTFVHIGKENLYKRIYITASRRLISYHVENTVVLAAIITGILTLTPYC